MEGASVDILERTQHYLDQLGSGRSVWAIYADYLSDPHPLLNRSRIEWVLCDGLVEQPPTGRVPVEAPPAVLARASGAMADWVAGQQVRRDHPPRGRLVGAPVLTVSQASLFARAWALWPENPALAGRHEALCIWLGQTPGALGWAAVALAAGGKTSGRAAACAARWLKGSLRGVAAADLVAALLAFPALRPYGVRALRRLLLLHRRDTGTLEALRQVAHAAGCYREVLSIIELQAQDRRITHRPDAADVVALVRCGAVEAAMEAYRRQWYGKESAFPDPLVLLPVLYQAEDTVADADAASLRRYLLAHHRLSEAASAWQQAWLRAESMDVDDQWETSLSIWFELFAGARVGEQRTQRGYFLTRLTEAFLKAPSDIRRAMQEAYDIDLRATWHTLRTQNAVAAEAALLLLAASPQQRIEHYRSHLAGVPLTRHRLVRHAARAYLGALLDMQYWDELGVWLRGHGVGERARVCTPEEGYFLEGMVRVREALSAPALEPEAWCSRWETLLSVPLADAFLIAALQHFVKIRGELHRQGRALAQDPQVLDVGLQLARRGKAVGMRMLARSGLGRRDAEVWQHRLDSALLDSLADLLREMRLRLESR